MSEKLDGSESPNDFDSHCNWLLEKMQEWEDNQKTWDVNSKCRMNYAFRKEIAKNDSLVKRLVKKALGGVKRK